MGTNLVAALIILKCRRGVLNTNCVGVKQLTSALCALINQIPASVVKQTKMSTAATLGNGIQQLIRKQELQHFINQEQRNGSKKYITDDMT